MRVRVIRWTDPTSSAVKLRVMRWCAGQWEHVPPDFELSQPDQANEFAMKLSMTKREPVETAAFEDGEKIETPTRAPISQWVIECGDKPAESQP